jgi:hypothetical protein
VRNIFRINFLRYACNLFLSCPSRAKVLFIPTTETIIKTQYVQYANFIAVHQVNNNYLNISALLVNFDFWLMLYIRAGYCSWEGYELTVIVICLGRTSIIYPVVFCECESWSLTLREERRLRVFESGVLRRVLWPKRHEMTGEWRP